VRNVTLNLQAISVQYAGFMMMSMRRRKYSIVRSAASAELEDRKTISIVILVAPA